jgi:ribonuclease HI
MTKVTRCTEKKKTPRRLITRGAKQKSDGHKPDITFSALSLYPTHCPCQDTTPTENQEPNGSGVRIFVKGICTPTNPGGYACWGWVATNAQGHVIAQDSGCVGQGDGTSSAVAEYHAVIHALAWARDKKVRAKLCTDSRLVFNQVSGKWLCSAHHLVGLCDQVVGLLNETRAQLSLVVNQQNFRALDLCWQAYVEASRGGAR